MTRAKLLVTICQIEWSRSLEYAAGHDKEMRLYSVTNVFEAGRVFLPKAAVWLPDYRQELLSFPGSKYDDQVDSTTQALHYIQTVVSAKLAVWAKLGST